jgi:DNA-binding CsgD family transcriptional regulator
MAPKRDRKRRAVTWAAAQELTLDVRRRLLADWCKLVGVRLMGESSPGASNVTISTKADPLSQVRLSPRDRQILTCLLGGDSEKQIALKLTISPHTVHTYVKRLHKTFDVNSRGELLSRFVNR